MKLLERIVFSLVGLSGLYFVLGWFFGYLSSMMTMHPIFSGVVNLVAIVGLLNWGIVAVTGNKKYDLFGLVGL